jgi:hypothetical protein
MPVSACPPSASPSGEAGGDTGYIKVTIFFYPASSIQYPVSETLWNKCSFSAGGSKFRVQGSKLKSDIIFNSTWNVER